MAFDFRFLSFPAEEYWKDREEGIKQNVTYQFYVVFETKMTYWRRWTVSFKASIPFEQRPLFSGVCALVLTFNLNTNE